MLGESVRHRVADLLFLDGGAVESLADCRPDGIELHLLRRHREVVDQHTIGLGQLLGRTDLGIHGYAGASREQQECH